ncbi:DUF4386 domain-containing protein [Catelliglobosispora koreensis]|uniref:DUF4386 domain-containing protein n=1 Tax=Catelliglobosispora koreensis TaxID=129052 RepID=UPI000375AD4B|nr:DUF4386 domain-containing protein [Catelliglobosispora koreensis]
MNNPKTLARIAGLLYLALAGLGTWAELYARATVYVPGNAAATADNIASHTTLFRLGLSADIGMATLFVFLGLVLYRLLHHVDGRAASTLMIFVAVGAGSILVNLTFHFGALLVATDASYVTALGADGAESLVLLLLELHHYGYILGGVFFGLWLLPMGFLAYRSELFPKTLGILLIVGSFAWLADPLIVFTLPDAPAIVRNAASLPTSIAEFGLILYLVIFGVRTRKPVASS